MLKKFIIFATLVATLFTVGCGMSQEEKEFVRAVEDDIIIQYEETEGYGYGADFIMKKTNHDMRGIYKYKHKDFGDEEFNIVANEYISYIETDEKIRNWNVSTSKEAQLDRRLMIRDETRLRYSSLTKLIEDYKLTLPDEIQVLIDERLREDKRMIDIYDSLEESMNNAEVKISSMGGSSVRIEFTNNTGQDIKSGYVKITLLNDRAYVVGEEEVKWLGKIEAGESYELFFYTPNEFDIVEIDGVFDMEEN